MYFNLPCSRYVSYVLKHITKVLGITWELRGGQHLAEDRGCVVVANHQTILDILGESYLSHFNLFLVSDVENETVRLFNAKGSQHSPGGGRG